MTLFPSPIKISRSSGAYDEVTGVWVEGTPATFIVEGSVQPLTAREVLAMDPEDRDDGMVALFTDADLKVSTKGSTSDGDLVVFQGMNYRLVAKDPFLNGLIPHYRYRGKLSA